MGREAGHASEHCKSFMLNVLRTALVDLRRSRIRTIGNLGAFWVPWKQVVCAFVPQRVMLSWARSKNMATLSGATTVGPSVPTKHATVALTAANPEWRQIDFRRLASHQLTDDPCGPGGKMKPTAKVASGDKRIWQIRYGTEIWKTINRTGTQACPGLFNAGIAQIRHDATGQIRQFLDFDSSCSLVETNLFLGRTNDHSPVIPGDHVPWAFV